MRESEEKEKHNAATENDAQKGSDKESQSPASDQNHQGNDTRGASAETIEDAYEDYCDGDATLAFIMGNQDLVFAKKATSAQKLLQDDSPTDFPDEVDSNMDSFAEIAGTIESEGRNES